MCGSVSTKQPGREQSRKTDGDGGAVLLLRALFHVVPKCPLIVTGGEMASVFEQPGEPGAGATQMFEEVKRLRDKLIASHEGRQGHAVPRTQGQPVQPFVTGGLRHGRGGKVQLYGALLPRLV